MGGIKLVTSHDIDILAKATFARPRLNLHESFKDPVQKMIYLQRPGDEKPPHCNSRELTKVILQGHSQLILYDDLGVVVETIDITPEGNCCYTLAPGTWHSNISITPVVFFEVMQGPYPIDDIKIREAV